MGFGDVIRSAASPSSFPMGIGGEAGVIWHCDSLSLLFYELSIADFSVVRSAPSPSIEPCGAGGDSTTIWHADYTADLIYELSIADFSVIRSAVSPATQPSGVGGKADTIWHCDKQTDLVYELSTIDFSVIRSAATPSTDPYGVGGDSTTIWHCDNTSNQVYELSTVDFSVVQNAASPAGTPIGIGGLPSVIWHCDQGVLWGIGSIYELDVGGVVAPTVNTNAATDILQEQAALNGTLDDDGGEACDCGFEWGETIAYGNTTPTQSRTTGQTFSQALSGLSPNVTYHFRAFATNSAGTGYGADRTFTTQELLRVNRAFALSREEL